MSFLLSFQITGNTPLMLAVKDNKTPLIDRLIELGSDVCARNNVSLFIYSFIPYHIKPHLDFLLYLQYHVHL